MRGDLVTRIEIYTTTLGCDIGRGWYCFIRKEYYMNYFIVKLTDGTLLDFRGMCNHVDMKSDERYIFYHKDGEGLLLQTLAVIPLRSIYYILTCTKAKEVEKEIEKESEGENEE